MGVLSYFASKNPSAIIEALRSYGEWRKWPFAIREHILLALIDDEKWKVSKLRCPELDVSECPSYAEAAKEDPKRMAMNVLHWARNMLILNDKPLGRLENATIDDIEKIVVNADRMVQIFMREDQSEDGKDGL